VIVLLDTSEALDVCAMELGCAVKQLITPLTGFLRQKEHDEFAIDNGAFAGFKKEQFLNILTREDKVKHLCRFLVVPDVVADARRTLEVFDHWKYQLSGWPLALAAQDGIENLPIPWKQLRAIFIGGTTEFKLSERARAVIRAAQAMGKYVHVGRVNIPGRFEYFESLGVDSIDGTGLSRYTHMREAIWRSYNQPNLLTDLAPLVDGYSLPEPSALSTAAIANEITAESTNGKGVSESLVSSVKRGGQSNE
jgi:hypothetical protein